jgi:hypothetical protein
MRSCHTTGRGGLWLAGLLGCALALGATQAGPAQKTPVPGQDVQAEKEKLIKDVFQAEYAKAQKDPEAKGQLATTLLQQGRETEDDKAGKYVLFREARDLAAQVGDVATALQAVEEMAQAFALKPGEAFAMKTRALATASQGAAKPQAHQNVLDSALLLLDDALNDDDYPSAQDLAATARKAAVMLKSVPLATAVKQRQQEVDRLQKAFEPLRPFADALRKDPRDAKANLMLGKYYAFIRGQWDRGLGMLAKSSDAALNKLANDDLAQPGSADKQAAIAEAWWKLADKADAGERTQLLLHAYQWYQQAFLQTDAGSPNRATLESILKQINERLPASHRSGELVAEVRKFEGQGPIYGVAVSADGRKVVGGGHEGVVRLWDGLAGKELKQFAGHNGVVWAVAITPDGRRVLSGGFDRTVRLWDPLSGKEVRQLTGHQDYVRSVAFSADGRKVVTAGDDRTVRLWSAESGSELKQFRGHDHFVWSAELSPDGKRVVSGSLDKTVRLWDVATGEELKKLTGHKDTVLSVAFAPDGRRAVSGSTDKTVILWDLQSGKALRTFTGHTGYVHAVAFAPDGRRVLSVGQDGNVRLWDIESGLLVRELKGHLGQGWDVSFSQDGRWAVSGGQDGTVRLWGGAK